MTDVALHQGGEMVVVVHQVVRGMVGGKIEVEMEEEIVANEVAAMKDEVAAMKGEVAVMRNVLAAEKGEAEAVTETRGTLMEEMLEAEIGMLDQVTDAMREEAELDREQVQLRLNH